MPCLASLPMLEEWLDACLGRNEAFPAALHFDTGMNRLGFRLNETSIVSRMFDQLGYAPQMIMSHLACADQPQHEKNRTQLALFQSVMAQFPGIPASLANSAGMMTAPRVPFPDGPPGHRALWRPAVNGRQNPMSPVVTLEAPILQIKDAKTGEFVGYGATQTLVARQPPCDPRPRLCRRLFPLAHVYQPGPAAKSPGTASLLPIIGRVSMDLVAIDITDLGNDIPVPGEMVEILGPRSVSTIRPTRPAPSATKCSRASRAGMSGITLALDAT